MARYSVVFRTSVEVEDTDPRAAIRKALSRVKLGSDDVFEIFELVPVAPITKRLTRDEWERDAAMEAPTDAN